MQTIIRLNLSIFLKIIAAILLIVPGVAISTENWNVGFYGLSYHTNISKDERAYINEVNLGLSLGRKFRSNNFSYLFDAGVFNNSYRDTAAWVGGTLLYEEFSPFGVGINLRHWWTANNTYENKIINIYGVVSYKINNSFSSNLIIRKSGPILYLGYDF